MFWPNKASFLMIFFCTCNSAEGLYWEIDHTPKEVLEVLLCLKKSPHEVHDAFRLCIAFAGSLNYPNISVRLLPF